MKLKLIPILSVAALATSSMAADPDKKIDTASLMQQVKDRVSVNADSNNRLTSIENGEVHIVTDNKLNMDIAIIKKGCLSLRMDASLVDKTNATFHDSSIDTGLGDGSLSSPDIAMKHLYVDSSCLLDSALRLQAGGLEVNSSGDLGVDNDGYIDGMRVAYETQIKGLQKFIITSGVLDPTASTNIWDRDFELDERNFNQITVVGSASIINYQAELTDYDDTNYYRAQVAVALDRFTNYLDSIGVEVFGDDEDVIGKQIAVTTARFGKSKANQVTVGYRDLEENSYPMDEKLLRDKSVFVKYTRQKEGSKCGVSAIGQRGDIDGLRADVQYNCRWK